MQTALKMAKGSLEMLGRRAQPHEEGDAKSDGGSKGASPEGRGKGDGGKSKGKGKSPEGKDAKSKKSPEDKGGKVKGDKRADLAKAHETKAALKEKFWNSNSNNEGAEAEKVWTRRQVRKRPLPDRSRFQDGSYVPNFQEDAGNTTWDMLEPSRVWEDEGQSSPFGDYNDVMTSKSALEDDETTTKDEDYKSCRLGSSLTTSPSENDAKQQKRCPRLPKEAAEVS